MKGRKIYRGVPCDAEFHMKIPAGELEEWRREAARAGITLSRYVKNCVRGRKIEIQIISQIEIEPLVRIAAEYGKIGSNINQIARHLNSGLRFSGSLYNRMSTAIDEMGEVTRKLAGEVEKINGDYKTQSIQKFQL